MENGIGVMILIINICKERLHYLEFVKPIKDILYRNNVSCYIKDYKNVSEVDLKNADKVIICGTSLFDNDFIKNLNFFNWLLDYDKPVLGICGGMQIIGLVFGGKLKKETEIGFFKENLNGFLGIKEAEVYHLHNYYVSFNDYFEIFSNNKIVQAVKHKNKEIYGCLFHPEVRQKDLIKNFCLL